MAATLAKPIRTAQDRSTSLGTASSLIAGQYVFERACFCTSFKFACVTWPANCMFVFTRIDGLGSTLYAKESYTQGAQSSRVGWSRLIDLSFLGLAAEECRHVQIVGGAILSAFPDFFFDLCDDLLLTLLY